MGPNSIDERKNEESGSDTSSALHSESALLGTTLGRYRITAILGRGSTGVVYEAEDEALRRQIALKVLSPHLSEDAQRRQRLMREAQTAAAVSHSNIAAVFDVGESNGLLYMAMERVNGTSLREHMKRARLSLDEIKHIAQQMLKGLAAAHESGIVHCDLKPKNVMIDDTGQVKILDFGLAKFIKDKVDDATEKSTTLTAERHILGTASYMSPEQSAGLAMDARTDVFSFGIILYEMVTGEQPFVGRDRAEILVAIERRTPIAPTKKNPKLPAFVERVILRCLQKMPGDRPANAREVLAIWDKEKTRRPESLKVLPYRWVALVLASIGLFVALLAARWGGTGAEVVVPLTSTSAVAAAAPAPTPITALLPSKTESTAALTAYREGIQALRDSSWPSAEKAFQRATADDPSFASAHLRVALTALSSGAMPAHGVAAFRKAVSLQSDFSERERAVLTALSFTYQRDPPDILGTRQSLLEASERFPLDAELLALAYSIYFATTISPDSRLRAAERCLRIDPLHADCLQLKAGALQRLGRVAEALGVYEHCVEVSPAGSDCLTDAMFLHMQSGDCMAMEKAVRQILTLDPEPHWYQYLGMALFARGENIGLIRGVMARRWENNSGPAREQLQRADDLQFALLSGRIAEFEKGLLERNAKQMQSTLDVVQSESTKQLIRFYRAFDRVQDAGAAAEAYASKEHGLVKGIFHRVYLYDSSLFFMRQRMDAGLIPRETFVAERHRWITQWESKVDEDMKPLLWLRAYVELVTTPEDAQEALAKKPLDWKFAEYYSYSIKVHH
ncbi:MAG TPA: protein kinase, partial [Polyangium sp.]|nr:protein kinase [Polyangium sp.]